MHSKSKLHSVANKLLPKIKFYIIPFVIFFCCSSHLFADIVTSTSHRHDASVTFLSYIFGYVQEGYSDILYGESILKTLFEYLNVGISTIGATIVCYITIVSLVNSAHSGTPMGQKWHNLFLPLRVLIGSGLLLPSPVSGYSCAQVLIMWFILTGINMANQVWDGIILAQSYTKGIFDPDGGPRIPNNISNSELAGFYEDLRQFAICVGTHKDFDKNKAAAKELTEKDESDLDIIDINQEELRPDRASIAIKCLKDGEESSCDEADTFMPKDNIVAKNCKSLHLQFAHRLTANHLKENAIAEYYNLVQDIKNAVAKDYVAKNDEEDKFEYYTLAQQIVRYQLISFKYLQGLIYSQDHYDKKSSARASGYASRIRAIGWLGAGSLYYELLSAEPSREQGSPTIGDFRSYYSSPSSSEPIVNIENETFVNNLNKIQAQIFADFENIFAEVDEFNGASKNEKLKFNPVSTSKDFKILDFITVGLNRLINFLVKEVLNTKNLFGYPDNINILDSRSIGQALHIEPLHRISLQGDSLLVLSEELISGSLWVLASTYAVGAASSLLPTLGPPAIITMIAVSVGVIFAVSAFFMLFYPIGIIMNIYIPLIPLFVWLFGIIGWFLICIEAMIAAPIVAIGLMHPDGNEVLGKAEQGLMMLLNLMLRPVLMIAGLVSSIVLIRIVILLFSWGINVVLGSKLMQINSTGAIVALSFIYTGILAMFVQQSFRLINQVPDKVLTWIGGPGSGIGEEQFTHQVKQEAERGGQKLEQFGSSVKSGYQSGYQRGSKGLAR